MPPSPPTALPALPPSEVEWEDVLLRMEIMQRVLRNTLEDVPEDDAYGTELLSDLVDRERRAGRWLEAVSTGAGPRGPDGAAPAAEGEGRPGTHALADRFVGLRARNFAMLQRRGLEVWRWTAEFEGYGPISAYQLVTWLVAEDVRALALLRERAPGGKRTC